MKNIKCAIFGHKWVLRGWGLKASNRNWKRFNCDRCPSMKEEGKDN